MLFNEKRRFLQNSLWLWYPFKPGRILLVKEESSDEDSIEMKDTLSSVLQNRGMKVESAYIKSMSDQRLRDQFDYVIIETLPECYINPAELIRDAYSRLNDDGILLFAANNRLGVRYFCGDRDPYTNHICDGIDNYVHADLYPDGRYAGRMYAKNEIDQMMESAGCRINKFYSVYSGMEQPFHLISHDYIPMEDLANRIIPAYYYPLTVFMEEERLYRSLQDNGMLHSMANMYLLECAKKRGSISDAKYITTSLDRSDTEATVTIVHEDDTVTKSAVYEAGNKRISILHDNLIRLRDNGIKTVDAALDKDTLTMPYIDAPTGQKYLQSLLDKDKNAFFHAFDKFMESIDRSSPVAGTEDNGERTVRYGYIDMVPLNSFFIDGEFVFFDQEFVEENYPVNVIKARALLTFFAYHNENRYVEDQLYERYGLSNKKEWYEKKEKEFLRRLWQEDRYDRYRANIRRNTAIAMQNRKLRNYPMDYFKSKKEDIFSGALYKECYVFGAGRYALDFVGRYGAFLNIKNIIDNDSLNWGKLIYGIEIVSPDTLIGSRWEKIKVFICVREYGDIIRQLDDMRIVDYSIYDKRLKYVLPDELRLKSNGEDTGRHYHVGYVAGAFDMFHIGHLNLLRRAKERCDYLIAGVMSDERIYELKHRDPVIPCNERMLVVEGCRYVDEAIELPVGSASIRNAYERVHFDCMFSGDDHADNPGWLSERDYLKSMGSDIVFFPYTKETSSSEIRERVSKQ